MSIRFQGIYRLTTEHQAGPYPPFKHYTSKQEILAINTLDKLRRDNPETAYFVDHQANVLIFRNDEKGDHFNRYNATMQPVYDEFQVPKQNYGFSFLKSYSSWVINPVMTAVKEAAESLINLVVNTVNKDNSQNPELGPDALYAEAIAKLPKIRVKYEVEPRARHYNGAQWHNGASIPGSPRVRSAFKITDVNMVESALLK